MRTANSEGESFYYVNGTDNLPEPSAFTAPTVVYLFRLAYMWLNQNSDGQYTFRICLECLGDSVTLDNPDEKCATCNGTGRIE